MRRLIVVVSIGLYIGGGKCEQRLHHSAGLYALVAPMNLSKCLLEQQRPDALFVLASAECEVPGSMIVREELIYCHVHHLPVHIQTHGVNASLVWRLRHKDCSDAMGPFCQSRNG